MESLHVKTSDIIDFIIIIIVDIDLVTNLMSYPNNTKK
jgi:hypothetical protein